MTLRDHVRAALVAALAAYCTLQAFAAIPVDKEKSGPLRDAWVEVRAEVKPWNRTLKETVGLHQGWLMFKKVARNTSRYEIAIDTGDGTWRKIFVERSAKHRWNRRTFEHHRWREFANRCRDPKDSPEWRGLNRFVAERVFADFPDAQRVRVRVRRTRVPSAEKLREDGRIRFHQKVKERITERPSW